MRRWNGWGDDSIYPEFTAQQKDMLAELIGKPQLEQVDGTWEQVLAKVPKSKLPKHKLVITDAEDRIKHSRGQSFSDWVAIRTGEIDSFPDGVAYVETREQVRELLDWAVKKKVAVIPYGGGTSVVGHLTPVAKGMPVLSLDLSRMNRLIDLDEKSQLATFGAGVSGADLEAQLRAKGYMLGHFPQSFEYSTLGGWIITRSSGQQSLRYGRIEQMFAGGHIETPNGSWDIPTIPATGAGTDVRELVLGSEGRMGVLTDATVRVTKLPQTEKFTAIFFPNWEDAETAVRDIVQAKIPLSMLRLSNAIETETNLRLAGHEKLVSKMEKYLSIRGVGEGKCLLLYGATGDKKVVKQMRKATKKLAKRHGGVSMGTKTGDGWLKNRFHGPYIRNTLWDEGYSADTIETAVDWSSVSPLMEAKERAAKAAFAEFGEEVHVFTHLSHLYGQGSSIYTTFIYRTAPTITETLERWAKYKDAVSQEIVKFGGTISHQHGVGLDHAKYLSNEKGGETGVEAMRTLFNHFDPKGIMNPGKLLED